MRRLNLILLALFLSSISAIAQVNFKQVLPPEPAPQVVPVFEPVQLGAIAYADVDNKNGLDVLVTGRNSDNLPVAILYINDGAGNYAKKSGTPFTGVYESAVAFADVDRNGTQDVLISGNNGSAGVTKLYLNDGNGNFTEQQNTAFENLRDGSIAFAEFDGNPGPDVVIMGRRSNNRPFAELYLNNGSGAFTLSNQGFGGYSTGSLDIADVDNNNTLDIVMAGYSTPEFSPGASPIPATRIYLNDGNASFTNSNEGFEGIRNGMASFADIDGDTRPDLVVSGVNGVPNPVTKLYRNTGNGNFTEVTSFAVQNLAFSSFTIADVNDDNRLDLFINGAASTNGTNPTAKLYLNNGNNNFAEQTQGDFTLVAKGFSIFLDIDSDNDQDLVVSGLLSTNAVSSATYVNNGSGNLQLATGTAFEEVSRSASAFVDVDRDGDEDVILTGDDAEGNEVAILYLNDGNGAYSEANTNVFDGVEDAAVAIADVDGQNGPDILISGASGASYSTTLYINNGNGGFTKNTNTNFSNLFDGSIAFIDIQEDNNSDMDVLITGRGPSTSFNPVTKLYTNDGNGNFTESSTSFSGVDNGDVAFGDVNGNGRPDLIISGRNLTKLYINNGNGNFSEERTFENLSASSIALGDVDDNGSLDLLISGTHNNAPFIKLYRNNGSGVFSADNNNSFEAVEEGAVDIADIDGIDGLDIIVSGKNAANEMVTKIYVNNGSASFTEVTNLPIDGTSNGNLQLSDVDNDGLLDVFITGINNLDVKVAKLYRNITNFDAFSITSARSVQVNEGSTASFYTAEADVSATFSLGSSKDEAYFELDGNELRFTSGPDFEAPQDADSNNEYLLDIIAEDQSDNIVVIELAVTVIDVDDALLGNPDEILARMYPNPVENSLFIKPIDMSTNATISIIDISGSKQKDIVYSGTEQEINVSDLESGLYFLNIRSNNKQTQIKFIKR